MSTQVSTPNLHLPVKAATALTVNTVCFVYPNGEVVVSERQLDAGELAQAHKA